MTTKLPARSENRLFFNYFAVLQEKDLAPIKNMKS